MSQNIETLKTVDLDVTEAEDLAKLVEFAKKNGAYLRVEVRKIKRRSLARLIT